MDSDILNELLPQAQAFNGIAEYVNVNGYRAFLLEWGNDSGNIQHVSGWMRISP